MYPYWILGIVSILMVLRYGDKRLLRFDWTQVRKWFCFLVTITFWRLVLYNIFAFGSIFGNSLKNASFIPWVAAFTVFWEDAVFGLPMLILKKKLSNKKWSKYLYWLFLGVAMCVFGSGHVYQGIIPAIILSLYVPLTVKLGAKHGFGTIMICHIMYDLFTMLFIKYMHGG